MATAFYKASEVTVEPSGSVVVKTDEGPVAVPGPDLMIVTNGVPNSAANLPAWFAAVMDANRAEAKAAASLAVKPVRVEVTQGDTGTRVAFYQ